MCLNSIQTKQQIQQQTSKNLDKPFYAWKVIERKSLRSPYRNSAVWLPGRLMARRNVKKLPIIRTVYSSLRYEVGLHLFLTKASAKRFEGCFSELCYKVIKVLVNPQSVVAWGMQSQGITVVVRTCRVCK